MPYEEALIDRSLFAVCNPIAHLKSIDESHIRNLYFVPVSGDCRYWIGVYPAVLSKSIVTGFASENSGFNIRL
jgi:hypothetical protein